MSYDTLNRVGISVGHHPPAGQACELSLVAPMLLVVPTTSKNSLDVGRQGGCRGGLLSSQCRCSRRADTCRDRCTSADPLQRVKQANPYCSQRVVGVSEHRQVGFLEPKVGSEGTKRSQGSGCRSNFSPCLPTLPPAVHPTPTKQRHLAPCGCVWLRVALCHALTTLLARFPTHQVVTLKQVGPHHLDVACPARTALQLGLLQPTALVVSSPIPRVPRGATQDQTLPREASSHPELGRQASWEPL